MLLRCERGTKLTYEALGTGGKVPWLPRYTVGVEDTCRRNRKVSVCMGVNSNAESQGCISPLSSPCSQYHYLYCMLFHCTNTRSLRCLPHRRNLQRFYDILISDRIRGWAEFSGQTVFKLISQHGPSMPKEDILADYWYMGSLQA